MGNCTSLPSVLTRAHAPARRDDAPAGPTAARQQDSVPTRVGSNALTGAGTPPARPPARRTIDAAMAAQMPEEVLGHVSTFLPVSEIGAVANLGHMGQAARGELRLLRAAGDVAAAHVEQVADLPGFLRAAGEDAQADASVTHALANLREDMRSAPLVALSIRIGVLTAEDRQRARAALSSAMSAVNVENRSADLTALLRVARQPDADTAALAGENLHHILVFHGTENAVDNERIRITLANGPARRDALVAANVRDVAERYGLDAPEVIAFLEEISASADGVAGRAVLAGANAGQTAFQYGIATPEGILALETRAIGSGAGEAVESGENVQEVAHARGIASDAGIELLETHAVLRAFTALTEGGRVREVANRVGIASERGVQELEVLAIGSLMEADPTRWFRAEPQDIIERLGLESAEIVDFMTDEIASRRAAADAEA